VQAVDGADAGGDGGVDVDAFVGADGASVDAPVSLSRKRPLPSVGSPKPLMTRPSSASEQPMRGAAVTFSMRSPRATPAVALSGMRSVASRPKPITSAIECLPPKLVMRHKAAEREREVGSLDRHPADGLHLPADAERHRAFDGFELWREQGH
jgi:hypothetical protein